MHAGSGVPPVLRSGEGGFRSKGLLLSLLLAFRISCPVSVAGVGSISEQVAQSPCCSKV